MDIFEILGTIVDLESVLNKNSDPKVRELENFMVAFSEDMMQMANMMSPEEKTITKTKLTNMISKI